MGLRRYGVGCEAYFSIIAGLVMRGIDLVVSLVMRIELRKKLGTCRVHFRSAKILVVARVDYISCGW